jgi:membrane-associated phospholipid phosphatase
LSLGLLLCGLLIVVAMAVSPWIKLSLHASFAAFAAVLLWPLPLWQFALASLAAAAIGWSRVRLARHTAAEVWVGSLIGALLGACFWVAA